jgi:peptide/nickel transport system substrate-binding protein
LEQGREEIDPTRRAAIYADIFEMLREHPSVVPIRYHENLVAVSNDLRGFTLSPAGFHRFADVYFGE